MPELPEVEITRRGVAQHFTGQTLLDVTVRQPRLRWPVPDSLSSLAGARLDSVERRSKYVAMRFGAQVVLVHLGMSGTLKVVDAQSAWDKHDHVQWLFEGKALRLNDPRRFGSVDLLAARDYEAQTHPRLASLGPEPLGVGFTPEQFFKATRGKTLSAKALLLSGAAVVGVGNIYACEALFRAAVRPGRAAGRLSRADCTRLHAAIVAVLGEAIERGGSTLRNFQAIDGELGHFQTHCDVYGREGQGCKRCEGVVKRRVMNQRSTFYCPGCQR